MLEDEEPFDCEYEMPNTISNHQHENQKMFASQDIDTVLCKLAARKRKAKEHSGRREQESDDDSDEVEEY